MERVVVTGGTGFTGSHLVRSLAADGHSVRVLARSAEKARRALGPDIEVVVGDVADERAVRRAIEGQDLVFHIAAAFREAGIPDRRYHDVNVRGTRHVLEAARDGGARRVVHCSTIGVHGHISSPPADENTPHRPTDIYQRTKSLGEQLALEFHRRTGFPVSVARPASIYGPGDRRLLKLFRMIASGRFIMLGSGEVCFHTVFIDDLVRGFRLLAEKEDAVGEAFILAADGATSLNDLAAIIAAKLEVELPKRHLPVWPFMVIGAVLEKVCIPLRIEPPIYRRRVGFFTHHREFSIDKARARLGFAPEVDVVTGMGRTADWYLRENLLPQRTGRAAPAPDAAPDAAHRQTA